MSPYGGCPSIAANSPIRAYFAGENLKASEKAALMYAASGQQQVVGYITSELAGLPCVKEVRLFQTGNYPAGKAYFLGAIVGTNGYELPVECCWQGTLYEFTIELNGKKFTFSVGQLEVMCDILFNN